MRKSLLKYYSLARRTRLGKQLSYHFQTDNPKSKSANIKILTNYFIVVIFLLSVALIITLRIFILQLNPEDLRITKNINIDLAKAIQKECEYDDLKIIYDNFEKINISRMLPVSSNVYPRNVDLTFILQDMLINYYKDEKIDTIYVQKLKLYIQESIEKNPFDKLFPNQKDLLISLRNKLGLEYKKVEGNVIAISNEIHERNETINLYLDKANQSYKLAIISLFISIIPILIALWKWINKKYINSDD